MATHAEDRTEVLGRRIAVALVDLVVLVLLMVLVAVLIGDTRTEGGSASFSLDGAPALVWLALALLYYGLAEAVTRARRQRLGDLLAGTRVVAADARR